MDNVHRSKALTLILSFKKYTTITIRQHKLFW